MSKEVVVLCNGRPPSKELFLKYVERAQLFVAADGGGNTAREYGVQPDLIIGDMDSYRTEKEEKITLIEQPDQETNDLEKALAYVQNREGTHVHILGATGNQLDQSLKNLSVLKQYDSSFTELLIVDDYCTVRLIPNNYSHELEVGTKLSLFPLSGKVSGLTTHGLKYSLKNETLENGVRDGSSNRVLKSPVQIKYEYGDLLLFVHHKPEDDFDPSP